MESHNPAEPSTTVCPLLPGQPVNVVELPIELGPEQPRDRSQSTADMNPVETAARTMDPADKFVNPRPAPKPRHGRLSSAPASILKLFGKPTRPLTVASSSQPFRSPTGGRPAASTILSRLLSPRMQSVCASAPEPTTRPTRIRRTSAPSSKRRAVFTLDRPISRRESIRTRDRSSCHTARVDGIAPEPGPANLSALSGAARGESSVRHRDDDPPSVTAGATEAFVEPEDGSISNEVGTPILQFHGPDDLVQASDVRQSSPERATALPDLHDMASRVPPLLQQLESGWDHSALAAEKPVAGDFSRWSTPSVRSISSSDSDDVLAIASPGLTHSGSYGSPLSEGIPARTLSSCPSVVCSTGRSTEAKYDDLSPDHFWRREPADRRRDWPDSLGSSASTEWASSNQGSWKPLTGFEGYRLPENECRSEATLRKLTGTASDHPVSPTAFSDPFDINRSVLPRSKDAIGFDGDLPDELSYLGKIIAYN